LSILFQTNLNIIQLSLWYVEKVKSNGRWYRKYVYTSDTIESGLYIL